MSCGNPRNAPCRGVLERVYPCLDGELDETGYEKIRPPANDTVFMRPVERPRFPGRLNAAKAGTPASPRTAAITAVFACPVESHRYWQQLAGRTSPYGGDFTVAGLPDDETC